MAIVDVVT